MPVARDSDWAHGSPVHAAAKAARGYLGKVPRTLRLRASSYEADHITAGVEFAGALVGVNVVPRSVAME